MSSWNKSIEFGIGIIDRDHRKLFDLIDLIQEEGAKRCPNVDTVTSVIRELREYANSHFKREEALMLASDYEIEAINPHVIEHEYFENFIKSVDILYRINDKLVSLDSVMEILRNWLVHHIGVVDRAYIKTVNTFCKKFKE